jgi:hypothetical protein
MKRWLAALGLAAMLTLPVETRVEGGIISFDTTPGGAGGSILYAGLGGPAFGTDIVFVDIEGIGTPLNSGVVLNCVLCLLDFVTGNNIEEGPTYQWEGGGQFNLRGSVPAIGIVNDLILGGSFTATASTPGLASAGNTGLFVAVGIDNKHPALLEFYGETNPFNFANTEIALGQFFPGEGGIGSGNFLAIPNQADIVNLAQVKQPWTLLLLGAGLIGVGLVGRRARA